MRTSGPQPFQATARIELSRKSADARRQSRNASFRYWTAAEALRRGADFWAPRIPSGNWEVGARLPVLLDEGVDLNAYYVQTGAEFRSRPGAVGHRVFGRKPRIVCHEMGHAILGDKAAALGCCEP